MDIPVSNRVDAAVSFSILVLAAAVAGHLWMPELVAWVQWFIADVIEPQFGLNDRVLS